MKGNSKSYQSTYQDSSYPKDPLSPASSTFLIDFFSDKNSYLFVISLTSALLGAATCLILLATLTTFTVTAFAMGVSILAGVVVIATSGIGLSCLAESVTDDIGGITPTTPSMNRL